MWLHLSEVIKESNCPTSQLTEVIQLRLIGRIGQHDRLDNNVMLKCNVGFEVAESFAKEMKFNLSDLLWDPVA